MKNKFTEISFTAIIFAAFIAVALSYGQRTATPSVVAENTATWYSVVKNKVFYSSDKGETWNELNAGLPDTIYPVRLYSSKNKIFLSTFSEGLFVLNKNERVWKNINSSLFLRRSFLEQNSYRKISAFAVDDKNENHLFVATKYSVYESTDGGLNWKSLPITGLSSKVYITALHYYNGNLYLGTSYDGFYKISENTAISISANLPTEAYSKTTIFFEQISVIKSKLDSLYLGLYFGGGAFRLDKKEWKPILDKSNLGYGIVDDIDFIDGKLFISCGGILYSEENGNIIKNEDFKKILISWV